VSAPLFERHQGSSALLLSIPHSGTLIPDWLEPRLTPQGLRLPDTDWHVPPLYRRCLEELDASYLIATHSRYVVDLNRPPDGSPLYPGRTETAICPTESFDGQAIYAAGAAPTPVDIAQRIGRYWRPYHVALGELRDRLLAAHGHCLIWDAHSIRSRLPRLFDGELPELNLGSFGGKSAAAERIARVARALGAQRRFSWVVDGRFRGGYITRHYGAPDTGVHALQLEIAQRAYLNEAGDEAPAFDAGLAQPLSSLLRQILGALH
jgi:N-formylglutamate deformylase